MGESESQTKDKPLGSTNKKGKKERRGTILEERNQALNKLRSTHRELAQRTTGIRRGSSRQFQRHGGGGGVCVRWYTKL